MQSNFSSINFNFWKQRGRPPIYKKRSLGKQGKRVEREREKWCGLGHWLRSMPHHKPNLLEDRLSFPPYKASWTKKLCTPPICAKDTYYTKIKNNESQMMLNTQSLCFAPGHPLGYGRCSRRLTGIIFVRGLSSRAREPSLCSVRDTWKEVDKGAPSRPFALRRSS